jgi:hypothetical protein
MTDYDIDNIADALLNNTPIMAFRVEYHCDYQFSTDRTACPYFSKSNWSSKRCSHSQHDDHKLCDNKEKIKKTVVKEFIKHFDNITDFQKLLLEEV